jgi:large subunit ribosomal protein L17
MGRTSAHLEALLASLVCGLIERRRIHTTLTKAKAARRLAERMVTLARKGTLAARRRAVAKLRRRSVAAKLWEMVPQFGQRQGGHTRIVKLRRRRSDGAELAILEWVDIAPLPVVKKKKKEKAEKPAA